jgi:galactokinase/mevalonate kinase-like predicted kinase
MPAQYDSCLSQTLSTHSFAESPSLLHALGFAHSSRDRLLRNTKHALETVMARALEEEREEAGFAIAAQDYGAIVAGGVVLINTRADGRILVRPVNHDPAWIERHVVIGYDPNGVRHDSHTILHDLINHRHAPDCVRYLSKQSQLAANALEYRDVRGLSTGINHAREVFRYWTGGASVLLDACIVIEKIKQSIGQSFLGWKPPGAGGACAVMIVTTDREAVAELIHSAGWLSMPARITQGLTIERGTAVCDLTVSAGYRIDFVGGSDLGQDSRIATDGLCLSAAIEPRVTVPLQIASVEE